MKKDKRFEKMATMPEKKLGVFRPSIISEGRPMEAAKDKTEEINQAAANFDGELRVRIPQSLYVKLNNEAEEENVPLEKYVLYKLASIH